MSRGFRLHEKISVFKQIVILPWLLLAVGCTTAPTPPVGPHISSDVRAEPAEKNKALNEQNSALQADLLYLLMTGEIAGQRGQYEVALDSYLKAAEWSGDPRIAERAAQIALYLKQNDKALKAATLWIERDPENDSARKIAALLYLKKGLLDQAVDQLSALLSLEGGDVEGALIDVAKLMSKEVEKADAFQVMDRLSRLFPQQVEIYYAYALLALDQDEPERALEQISKALKLRSDWDKLRLMQAQLLTQLGDSAAAREVLLDALKKDPQNTHLRMIYAQFLIKTEEYELAEQEYEKILKLEPDNHEARFAYGMIQLQLEHYAQAKKALLKLTEEPKWQAQAYFYLGRLEAKRDDFDAALHWLDKIPADDPLFLDAQMTAASVLAKLDRLSEALEKVADLRERFPDQALQLYLLEAELLNGQKDYAGAFETLTRALEEMPGQEELLYSRALIAERLNRLHVLEADLTAILAKDPDNVNALNALGYTLADRTNRYEEAHRYLERAIELKPDDPAIMDSYGWLLFHLGRYESALDYLRRAYERNQDPEIAAHLGEVLWAMDKRDEAKSIWRQIIKKHPDDEHAQKIRQRFQYLLSQ